MKPDLNARISAAKEKIRVADAWRLLNLPHPPRAGNVCVKSPFRPEKSASFSIFAEGRAFNDHADDTAKGDVICFIRIAAHCDYAEARRLLLGWAGDHAPIGHRKHAGAIVGLGKAAALVAPPPPPPPPDPEDVTEDDPEADPFKHTYRILPGRMSATAIAVSRRLPIGSTSRLAEAGILRTMMGAEQQWVLVDGPEMPRDIITAEIRRYDRRPFGHGAKAHTCKGATKGWPIGLSLAMKDPSQTIILVEGGPDLLAAYALIEYLSRHDCVAIAILGREIRRLIPEAQRVFAGRDVLILPHRDKDKSGEITDGQDAAVEWARMLLNDCGAADVSMSSLEGLTRPDGQPAKDLCEAIEDGGLERNAGVLAELLPPAKEQTIETI